MEDNILDELTSGFDNQAKRPLPNAQTAFVLGILSIVPGCMCCILGLPLGIIGIVLGSNAEKEYYANPEAFTENDLKNAQNGKKLAIVGLAITAFMFIIGIIGNLAELAAGTSGF